MPSHDEGGQINKAHPERRDESYNIHSPPDTARLFSSSTFPSTSSFFLLVFLISPTLNFLFHLLRSRLPSRHTICTRSFQDLA
ncbi:hypothetical protein M440DRAFT_1401339 [Trichoderma longibrachiatum ATCC 18648]|uniref:Uncharacterized protein n=1 Tax=Trichoderma longibrachiatum ATCC 18648 TaxID=983965 RepID=A0A2T4C647_TRILO|nr:hypothetical protein M440DRAFT_1401339 [Trichoderma longibrachiatum ATCC 18648]